MIELVAVELDEMDLAILGELIEDARRSYREIAKRLNISVGTVAARVKRMEALGVIKGYSAMVDYEKLGYELTVVTEVTVSKGRLLEVQREISLIPNTISVYDVTGTVDSIVVSKFRNRQEVSNFTKKLLSIPYVERTNTHVVLTVVKEDPRGPLLKELGKLQAARERRPEEPREEVGGYG
jgi:DNA-binding Lrp family transcriptional regulator